MLWDTSRKKFPSCGIQRGKISLIVGYYRETFSSLWDTTWNNFSHCGILHGKISLIVGYYMEKFPSL